METVYKTTYTLETYFRACRLLRAMYYEWRDKAVEPTWVERLLGKKCPYIFKRGLCWYIQRVLEENNPMYNTEDFGLVLTLIKDQMCRDGFQVVIHNQRYWWSQENVKERVKLLERAVNYINRNEPPDYVISGDSEPDLDPVSGNLD